MCATSGRLRPLPDRFWDKVNKTAGCWLWTDHPHTKGYGTIGVNGRLKFAHRVSYELARGPIPAGMLVCHTCDTRLCVRPDHLFLGTAADNMRDAMLKKRLAWGERARGAKLTADDVARIKVEAEGASKQDIQTRYGISRSHLNAVLRGAFWANLGLAPRHTPKPFVPQVTDDDVRQIRAMRAESPPVTYEQIARLFRIRPSHAWRIATGARRSKVA